MILSLFFEVAKKGVSLDLNGQGEMIDFW